MAREILVVPREILFSGKYFDGFCSVDDFDYMNLINENFQYNERNDELENDPSLKQIIPYVWIVNKSRKEVFIYKRAKTGNEGRLHDKYSGGVGGHIDKDTEETSINPIKDAMMRELREEVFMNKYPVPKYIGFINDDSADVGKVHFGVAAVAETDEHVKPVEDMASGRFYSLEEVVELFSNPEIDVESWTRISWPAVRNYLEN